MTCDKGLAELGLTATSGSPHARIHAITLDSRAVKPGTLFAALPGTRMHGGEFIDPALRMGASVVLTDREGAEIAADSLARHPDAAVVLAEDPRATLALTAALFFGAQPETMVAVTGTNGKTSVASFARQLWVAMGQAAINVGTTGVEGAWQTQLAHTTPDAVTLQRLLAEAAQADVTHAAMEASSHGLDQRRLEGVNLKAAAFTNLSQDHLDYHPTMDAYFDAKCGLFDRLLPDDGIAVVNTDDPWGQKLAQRLRQPVMRVGQSEGCDLRILAQRFNAHGQELRFSTAKGTYQVQLSLVGGFQAANALVALGLVLACGADEGDAVKALSTLTGVRGRMELAATRQNGAPVFVDYAHTPAAVETALKALRPHVMGRLVVVLGAGGDRDKGKRPLMGQAAAENADVVFVTDDNPRSEDPATIRAEILKAAPEAIEVGDRAEAILRGVDALGAGDALLVAGKGHETGQKVGDVVYPFDDVEQASVAVAALDGMV